MRVFGNVSISWKALLILTCIIIVINTLTSTFIEDKSTANFWAFILCVAVSIISARFGLVEVKFGAEKVNRSDYE